MNKSAAVMDCLLVSEGRTTVNLIATTLGLAPRLVSSLLYMLGQAGRVSSAALSAKRYEFWLTPEQVTAEHARRVEAAKTSDPVGVAILISPVRLAGRLMYLERLQQREVFAHDATFAAIVNDYRATLAALRGQMQEADADEVHA